MTHVGRTRRSGRINTLECASFASRRASIRCRIASVRRCFPRFCSDWRSRVVAQTPVRRRVTRVFNLSEPLQIRRRNVSPPLRYCISSGRGNDVDPRDFADERNAAEKSSREYNAHTCSNPSLAHCFFAAQFLAHWDPINFLMCP